MSLHLRLTSAKSFTHIACRDSESACAGVFSVPPETKEGRLGISRAPIFYRRVLVFSCKETGKQSTACLGFIKLHQTF